MKSHTLMTLLAFSALAAMSFGAEARAQELPEKRIGRLTATRNAVRWNVAERNAGVTLIVAAPDGRVFRKEFRAGANLEFPLTDKDRKNLPDGTYMYELHLVPSLSAATKEKLRGERGRDDEPEAVRSARVRSVVEPLVESGSFTVVNGQPVVSGGVEPQKRQLRPRAQAPAEPVSSRMSARLRNHLSMNPDQVIPDDLIVQGSECVGFDCVNNENFGFDTIRLKENNLRIKFEDTSTLASYPTNDWQLTANDSASGGASKFSIDDVTGNKVPFTITAGASTNSIFVDSVGRVGFRTAVPVLDLHVNTGNTPAVRFEQNNSGGWGTQTWDIGANEANFFVRDVTSGSRLPFRIRPGAPTSSIDIAASGNVGVGTASPTGAKVFIFGGNDAGTTNAIQIASGDGAQTEYGFVSANQATEYLRLGYFNGTSLKNVFFDVSNTGRVGIGTTAPDQTLSVNGDASKVGGGSWQTFSDERLKLIKGQFRTGLNAVMQLRPLRYEYRRDNPVGIKSDREYIGFSAQAVQKVIPEAVNANAAGYLMVNSDPILWSMVNAIQEQQRQIEQLKKEIRQLRSARTRRRR